MRRSKRESQLVHTRRRLRERFAVEGSAAQLDTLIHSMIERIKDGRAEHIEKQSNRVSLFRIELDGYELYPIYDRQRKMIVTVLTKDMVGTAWALELHW